MKDGKSLFSNNSAMEKLIYKYCTEEYIIDGVKTYIIPKERYDELYHYVEISDMPMKERHQPNTFNNITLMPMYESDICFLPLDVIPEIPPIFKKIPCQKCGKPLNRRFLKIR